MRLPNTSIFLSIYVLIGCLALQSQSFGSYDVKHYDILDGLSNNWVSDIFQDKDGFLWFGTQYGLNRFDGQKFKIFTYIPGDSTAIKANWVRCITQFNDNNIYLGTLGGGVNVLDPYQENFTELPISKEEVDHNVFQINNLIPNNDNIWISSSTGAFQYRPQDSTLKKIYDRGTSNLVVSEDKSVLVLGARKKEIYNIKNDQIKKLPVFKDEKILNLYPFTKDSTLVYTAKKLVLLYKSDDNWQSKQFNFKSTYTTSVRERPFIFKDKDGWIWINAGKKIYKFSPDLTQQDSIDLKLLLNFRSAKNLKANCMLQDKEGNYWIGTNLGVFQHIPHKQLRHPIIGGLGKVREIEDCGSRVWFALADGIYVWDKGSNESPKKINESVVISMKCASDGYLYTLGRDQNNQSALLKIDPSTMITKPIYFDDIPFSLGVSWRIVEDIDQRLWIAQWDNILIYNLKDQSYFTLPVFKENTGIIELFPDNQDNMWVGSIGKGLLKYSKASTITKDNRFKPRQFLHKTDDPNSISSDLIQSIHQDPTGLLWIGTDGGLNNLDISTEKFHRFLRNDQMPNDKILNITSDKKGILWLSTISRGILSYNPNTNKFSHFTARDGLYDNSMVLSSVHKNKDGYIWMGSESGIQYFHPDNLFFSKKTDPNLAWLSYTRYRSDTTLLYKFPNKGSLSPEHLKIQPEDQSINFKFQILTFEKPEKVRYHFMLKGYHESWLPAQETGSLTLSYLPKGSYELLTKATFEDQWEISYAPIAVTVIPPWYKTNLAYVLYSILLLTLVFVMYQIQLRRKIAETEKEFVTDLSKARIRWFNQIAHEFRTPLTVILGAIDQIRDRLGLKTNTKTEMQLSQIEDQANHLSNQVQKILEIAQMQENQLGIQLTSGDFIVFQKYLFHSFTSLAEKKNIALQFSSSNSTAYVSFDEDKWRKITTNLVSNAIKYNMPGGIVSLDINIDEEESHITLQVRDTGIGMSKNFISKLFDPFSKEKTDNPQGVGLGLALTKELVSLMKGTITVESQKEKGSVFTVSIPATLLQNKTESIHQDLLIYEDQDNPVVLIAEDHKEVRDYIRFCLSSEFTVLQAENGIVAWELCQKHIPDLVISDIMMPQVDGIQLGIKIRKHVSTNHIPLIFLTAKSGQSNQIEGLKIGADAYLTKPFDRNELLIRVNNLIQTRKKLQEKYQRGDTTITLEHKTIDHFMKEVVQIIHKQLDNDEFGVPQLAENLHISRVHLFRKIKNLTGLPPTKFIRKIRLHKAQELLGQTDLTISGIAYQTGFKDPAYFSRVYTEEFGQSPSEYRKQ